MTAPNVAISNTTELIDHLTGRWQAFVTRTDQLSGDTWLTPRDATGWSVKDHVSHATQWDVPIISRARTSTAMQETLAIPDAEWQRQDYEAINERIRQRHLYDSIEKVKQGRDKVWTELLAALASLTGEHMAMPAAQFGLNVSAEENRPLLQALQDYIGGHYEEHLRFIDEIVRDANASEHS